LRWGARDSAIGALRITIVRFTNHSAQPRRAPGLLALMLWAYGLPSLADEAAPDKGDYILFNPTPDADLRSFSTDRPPKANSPYTVDAGHLQYETESSLPPSRFRRGTSRSTPWMQR